MKFCFLLFCCQPAIMACMGQTASLAANARTEASAAVSVDASVPEGGEDSTVIGLVGILTATVICMFFFHYFNIICILLEILYIDQLCNLIKLLHTPHTNHNE